MTINKARRWDRTYNEGYDGYNPYRETTRPQLPVKIELGLQADDIRRIMSGTSTDDKRYIELQTQLDEIEGRIAQL